MEMATGQPSNTRYIALNAQVEDVGNSCRIVNSRMYCTAYAITGQGGEGENVGEGEGNETAGFEVIDDADVCSMVFDSIKEAESFYTNLTVCSSCKSEFIF